MEKCNISESLRSLIIKLLSNGLAPHYNEVISFMNSCQNDEDLKYLIYALNYLKEDSLLLKLKIQDYELQTLIKYLEKAAPVSNNKNELMITQLTPSEDGFIYIDASDSQEKKYYPIPKHLIGSIRLIHIDYPDSGLTRDYFERSTKVEEDGKVFEYIRKFTFDSNGLVSDIEVIEKSLISAPRGLRPNLDTIYKGLVGELFEDLLKQSQNTEVTINDL